MRDNLTVLRFSGRNAFESFRREAGGHRFQGISPTDKKRRPHSSTVTVAVLRDEKEVEVEIRPGDLKIEAYTGDGPGGQNRNKNATNIRITHLPTGIQACSNVKSRKQNEKLALALLKKRLVEKARGEMAAARNSKRRSHVGTGERSDKIRTIAEQRGRVENHISGKRMKISRYERGFIEEIY